MSFHYEFMADKGEDAREFLKAQHDKGNLPTSVYLFVGNALEAYQGKPVYVKASGHLYTGSEHSHPISSSVIDVRPPEVKVQRLTRDTPGELFPVFL